jgi:hypothetical protein
MPAVPLHESATKRLVIPTRERSEAGGICLPRPRRKVWDFDFKTRISEA